MWDYSIFHVAILLGPLFTGFTFMLIWIIMDQTPISGYNLLFIVPTVRLILLLSGLP